MAKHLHLYIYKQQKQQTDIRYLENLLSCPDVNAAKVKNKIKTMIVVCIITSVRPRPGGRMLMGPEGGRILFILQYDWMEYISSFVW